MRHREQPRRGAQRGEQAGVVRVVGVADQHAVASMSPEALAYKGLTQVRDDLLAWLVS